MGRAAELQIPDSYDDDTPLRIEIAAQIAFPGGQITASALRLEITRGTLEAERIGGKTFTTLRYIKQMRAKCRLRGKAQDSGSGPIAPSRAEPSGEARGSSSTPGSISPLDALQARLTALSSSSPPTSRRNTSRVAKSGR